MDTQHCPGIFLLFFLGGKRESGSRGNNIFKTDVKEEFEDEKKGWDHSMLAAAPHLQLQSGPRAGVNQGFPDRRFIAEPALSLTQASAAPPPPA